MRIRRGLGSRRLPCGCVAGIYETYRDEIVIYRVFATKAAAARRFLLKLKEELKRDLKQEEILIVEKEAELL